MMATPDAAPPIGLWVRDRSLSDFRLLRWSTLGAEAVREWSSPLLVDSRAGVNGGDRRACEGKSETLARLLKRRFGPLPEALQAHIAAANLKQLDRWLDAVLDAPTLDPVLGGASEHR